MFPEINQMLVVTGLITGLIMNLFGIVTIWLKIADRLTKIEERFNGHIEISDRDVAEVFRRLSVLEERK